MVAAVPSVRGLWSFAREREKIRLRRAAGEPPPWTKDDVLARFRFCNVRRADDAGTQWYLDTVAESQETEEELLWSTVFYRLVNNPAWFDVVGFPSLASWKKRRPHWETKIRNGPKVYSPAYLTFGGASKGYSGRMPHSEKLILSLRYSAIYGRFTGLSTHLSLEGFWKWLQEIPHVGPFIATQVYRDLFLARALRQFDEDSFVYLGPGARSGLALLGAVTSYDAQLALCEKIWKRQLEGPWGERLLLADVQSLLCEARKYWNIRAWLNGKRSRPKLRYYKNGVARV